jgi:hypothetical protein
MTGADLERHFIELQYQTGQSPPDKADDDAAAVKKVAETAGAIAAVDAAVAKGAAGIKIVLTQSF